MTGTDCPVCGERFDGETGVRDHAWDAHGACHHCADRFESRETLYTHWLDAHEGALSSEARKRAENAVGDRTVCPACGDRFSNLDAVAAHARDAHGACHRCGETFDDDETVYAHWLGAHGDDLSRTNRDRATSAVGELTFRQRLAHQGPAGAMSGVSVSRRALLGAGGVGLAAITGGALVTGAFGDGGGDQSLQSHPAAAGLGAEPTLGPDPTEADGTIVAFEDPSCPSCARFELGTFPELRSRLVETGTVSFVYRGIPVVYPWGEPAALALESTYARNEAAFWALKEHYYRVQNQIGSDNVRDVTRQFLDEETDIDAAAVIADVEAEAHRDAVDADLRASRRAGVSGTPTFYLFREESYATSLVGPQSFGVFKNALGV